MPSGIKWSIVPNPPLFSIENATRIRNGRSGPPWADYVTAGYITFETVAYLSLFSSTVIIAPVESA